MNFFRKALAVGFVAAATTAVACSSQQGSSGTGSGSGSSGVVGQDGSLGSVGFNFTLPNGAHLYSLNWTISGPNSYSGVVHVNDAQSVEFVAGGILAGSGYTLTLTGTSTGGDVCLGTSPTFGVIAGAITSVAFNVTCTTPTDAATTADVTTGGVEVDAGVISQVAPAVACPGISSLSIDPAEIQPTQSAQLNLLTAGPASVITWTVTTLSPTPGPGGGTFSPSANVANPTFLGSIPGSQVQITATVSLPDSGACAGVPFTSLSALVNVEGVNEAGAPVEASVDAAPEASAPEASIEASVEAEAASPPPLHACVVAGDTNCVRCEGNESGTGANGGLCTRTEAAFVNFDIAKGFATAPGDDPAAGCYTCLYQGGALDDTVFPDTGNECDDLTGTFTAGDGFSGAASDICVATLDCVLGGVGPDGGATVDCASTNGGVSNCYCGPGGGSPSVCPSNGASTNGSCKTAETNGFLATANDAVTILNNYNNLSQPSGKANQFFVFANGTCNQCLQ